MKKKKSKFKISHGVNFNNSDSVNFENTSEAFFRFQKQTTANVVKMPESDEIGDRFSLRNMEDIYIYLNTAL